jgi:hypothetical protein
VSRIRKIAQKNRLNWRKAVPSPVVAPVPASKITIAGKPNVSQPQPQTPIPETKPVEALSTPPSPPPSPTATCYVDGCTQNATQNGLCGACHQAAQTMVDQGETTWRDLYDLGLVPEPNLTAFLAAYRAAKARRNEATIPPERAALAVILDALDQVNRDQTGLVDRLVRNAIEAARPLVVIPTGGPDAEA